MTSFKDDRLWASTLAPESACRRPEGAHSGAEDPRSETATSPPLQEEAIPMQKPPRPSWEEEGEEGMVAVAGREGGLCMF